MTNDPQDIRTYKALDPADVQRYLKARAWRHVEDIGRAGQRWEWPPDPEQEVLLALCPESGEYAQRMAELVQTVARVEGRSRAQVLEALLSAGCDIVRVRLGGGAELPLKQGVEAIDALPKLLQAAAQAERRTSAYYAARLPNEVKAYMDTLMLKQTEVGSFVLRLASPLGEPPHALSPSQPPLGRRVVERLARSVAAAADAVEVAAREERLGPLEKTVTHGVSANLLDALATFGESCEEGFVVEVDWAVALEAPELPRRVAFEPAWTPLLRKAAVAFRKRPEGPRIVRLKGGVSKLEREPSEEEVPRGGTIQLWTNLDARPLKVEAELNSAEYQLALDAHSQDTPIWIRGALEQQAKRWVLRGAHGVELWNEQDDGDREGSEDDF